MKSLWGMLLIGWYFSNIFCFFPAKANYNSDHGNPLVLTSFIQQGKIKDARDAAEVKFKEFRGVKSYSGYFKVDDVYNSHLFFWFFPSKIDYEKAPVVLWLQGGPGVSSLYGLFCEHGPFFVNNEGGVDLRKYTWSENHSVIYIDNPVGTGFSFTDDGYAQNETIVGEHLYNALLQFFKLFPELQSNDFYATGESYAGKYVPAVAYTIHKNNPSAMQLINLQGLAIGNGWVDPEHQENYADYSYQPDIKLEMYKQRLGSKGGVIMRDDEDDAERFLNRHDVKTELHVGKVNFSMFNGEVSGNLDDDYMKSVAPWVSILLSYYRVMFYSGELDTIVPYNGTVNFLKHLNFSAAHEYKTAKRHPWYVNSELAGYVKEAGNLTEVLVLNAYHMVPKDQPVWALDMITKFTCNKHLY